MKTTIVIGLIAAILLFSCKKEIQNSISSEKNSVSDGTNYTLKVRKKHIYYSQWDEWGRSNLGCNGWGLCNFVDCWFCCTENDVIVNCNNGIAVNNSGIVEIDVDSGVGFLTIELNPNFDEQNNAILNSSILYIDDDIIGEKVTLLKGEYHFSTEIGEYGGYRVDARES